MADQGGAAARADALPGDQQGINRGLVGTKTREQLENMQLMGRWGLGKRPLCFWWFVLKPMSAISDVAMH